MTVSTHSSRPPISDSQSQIAASLDVLALVPSVPVTWLRDRSRSRAHPDPVGQQPGHLVASRQRQLAQLGACHGHRRGERAAVEPQRERHVQAGQVHRAGDRCAAQPHPPRIDLIPQLTAAAAEQGRVHRAPRALMRAVQDLPLPPRVQQLGLADVLHGPQGFT